MMPNYQLGWKNIFIVVGVGALLTLLPGKYGNLGAVLVFSLLLAFVLFEANYYHQHNTFFVYGET